MIYQRLRRLFHYAALGDHRYRFLFEPGPADEVVVLDCETTGLNPKTDDVISVAAVKVRGRRILTSERFEATVRSDADMSAEAVKVHRLRHKDIEGADPMHRVLPDLLRFIGGRPLVGYYIDFDVAMLDKYVLNLIQTGLPNPRIEVSGLYYDLKYGKAPPLTVIDLRFAAILADLGLPDLGQHDALNDVIMTAMMYVTLKDMKERRVSLYRPGRLDGTIPTGG